MNIGAPELVIVLAMVLLLFGANRLPGLARGLGSAMYEFRKGAAGDTDPGPGTNTDTHIHIHTQTGTDAEGAGGD